MKTSITLITAISALALAVAARAQVVIGNWQNDTGDGWIDNGNSLSITNLANTNKYQFVTGAVTGFAQSLEINQAGFNQNLEIDLNSVTGGKAAFAANHTLSFTVSFPPAAASGATAGYSQIYNFTLNCSGLNTNIPWSAWVGNSGNMPGVGYYPGFGGQTITVTWDYSSLLTNSFVASALTNTSYLQLSFTSNNGGGAPTNIFMNDVVLAGALPPVQTYVVDDFSPNGVGPQNPTNDDYYSSSNNYAGGQITNVWGNWFGGAFQSLAWDPATDVSNNPDSGSLEISLNFSSANSQFVVWDQGTVNDFYALGISGTVYTNFECDVKFAPVSASDSGTFGSPIFGHLRFGDRTTSYGQDWFGAVDIAATNTNWVHVNVPLDIITDTNLLDVQGLIIGLDESFYGLNLNGPSTLWVDNVKFTCPTVVVAPPPPVLSIQKAVPALRIFAGSTANTYDREELATIDQNQSWVGGSYPVSYSFTLLDYPSDIGQTHIFIVPVNTSGQANMGNAGTINEFIEYQASNTLWMIINPAGNGAVTASVQWKTNLPNANPNITGVTITNSTAIGAWTLSFSSATSGTLTAPGAAPAAFTIADPTVTTDFANPAVAYFGIQPNATAGEGEYEDWQSISVTGVSGTQENENFSAETTFDTGGIWANNSAQTNSLQLATSDTPYWVNWTLPAQGYSLGTAESILGNTNTIDPWMLPEYYNDYGGTGNGTILPGIANQGSKSWVLIPSTCLPTVDGSQLGVPAQTAFFKLSNPPLQN